MRRFHDSLDAGSGLVPQEDAMRLDPCAFSNEPSNEDLGRRKRKQDAVRIDAAIKTALDEFANDEERRAAFLRLLACMRTLTARISVSGRTTGCSPATRAK